MGSSRRSEEHTSELQSLRHLVCRLLLEKKKGCLRFLGVTLWRATGSGCAGGGEAIGARRSTAEAAAGAALRACLLDPEISAFFIDPGTPGPNPLSLQGGLPI